MTDTLIQKLDAIEKDEPGHHPRFFAGIRRAISEIHHHQEASSEISDKPTFEQLARVYHMIESNFRHFEHMLHDYMNPPKLEQGEIRLLDPDMGAQELRLHMGELSAQEMRAARAAIRWANTKMSTMRESGEEAIVIIRTTDLQAHVQNKRGNVRVQFAFYPDQVVDDVQLWKQHLSDYDTKISHFQFREILKSAGVLCKSDEKEG